MNANPSGASHANIPRKRTVAAGFLLLVPLAVGLVSVQQFFDNTTTALVVGATPFVIVEIVDKLIEFLLQGNDTDDWFARRFEQVRVVAALISGSFAAGALAGEHYWAAVIGVGVLILLLISVRAIRRRQNGN